MVSKNHNPCLHGGNRGKNEQVNKQNKEVIVS